VNTQSGLVYYSQEYDGIVGDTGDRYIKLEMSDIDMQDADYRNESWDYILSVYKTREMSFDNPGVLKKIKGITSDNNTYRDVTDLAPPDVATLTFYQDYNIIRPTANKVYYWQRENLPGNSFTAPVDVNLYTGLIRFMIARTVDTENPKLILKDMILEIADKQLKREGVW
jgi:hypothetical protein